MGYFRGYIKDFAKIIRPLNHLKKSEVPFVFNEECKEAFKTLKEGITQNPVLDLPNWDLPIEIHCDASQYATGSILMQRDDDKPRGQQFCSIGYQSYTFSKTEQNYSVTEKEALALIVSIKYFRSYIEGRDFTVFTDHHALKYLMTLKEAKGRLARWQIFLQQFLLNIKHRPGALLTDADVLSRLCPPNVAEGEDGTAEKVHNLSSNTDNRITPGKSEIPLVLWNYHDSPHSGGHDGIKRTLYKLSKRFRWKGMREDVIKYVNSCPVCQTIKFRFKPRRDEMFLPVHSQVPFDTFHLDFGETAKKSNGNQTTKSFVVVIDEFTKYCDAQAMREDSESDLHGNV
jgi:hypothetical protein